MRTIEFLGPIETDIIETIQAHQEEAQAYLNSALAQSRKEKDLALLLQALRALTKAKGGLKGLYEKSSLNLEDLYAVLSGERVPQWEEMYAIALGLGYYLAVTRKQKAGSRSPF